MPSLSQDTNDALFTVPSSTSNPTNVTHAGFRCQISREQLLPTLGLMQAIAESHPSLPILSHVFLRSMRSQYARVECDRP